MCGGQVLAHPQDTWPRGLSGSVGIVTDYVDRGVSQSDGHAAVQGGIEWQHSTGAYVALWGSTVDFDDGGEASAEVNYILGIERELGPTQVDVNIAYVHYPGAAASLDYDIVELGASVSGTLGTIDVAGHAIFSPSNAGASGQALYVALEATRNLTETMDVRMHVGRQWHERNAIAGADYHDWGLALQWGRDRLNAALGYSDTDQTGCADICDARLAASVEVSF